MMEAILNGLLGGGNRDSSPCGEDDEAMQSEDASRPCYAFRLYHWEEVEPRAPGGSPAALSTSFGRHLPKPRSGHKVVYYRGGLYSFGGYNPKVELSDPHLLDDPYWKSTRPLFKELWRFGVHSRRWCKLSLDRSSPVPDQLASHSLAVHGDRMLLYGGTGAPFGLTTSNAVYAMDMLLRRWEKLDVTVRSSSSSDRANEEQADPAWVQGNHLIQAPPPIFQQFVVAPLDMGGNNADDSGEEEDDTSEEDDESSDSDSDGNDEGGGEGEEAGNAAAAAAPAPIPQLGIQIPQVDPLAGFQVVGLAAHGGDDAGHEPTPLYGQAVLLHGTDLYTVGGTSGFQYFMDVHRLDLTKKRWERLFCHDPAAAVGGGEHAEPTPRYRHELAFWQGHLFVLGGGTSFEACGFTKIAGFSLANRRWEWFKTHPDRTVAIDDSVEEQLPAPRRCHSVVQNGKFVFLMGGYDGQTIFSDWWRLDLDTMDWTKMMRDPPVPVYFHASSITSNGKLFMFGGVNRIEDNCRTAVVQSAWVRIPSLRDMAFDALNYYCPDLSDRRVDALVREGVPRDLINELHGHGDAAG